MGVWPLSLGEGHGPPTLVELFSGRATEAPSASAYRAPTKIWVGPVGADKRAREQPKRYTGEETVRGPREERLGSTVRFWHVVGAALGFSFASQPTVCTDRSL